MTALGRQEEWEDSPEGYPRTPPYGWWIWHDDHPTDPSEPVEIAARAARWLIAERDLRTRRQVLRARRPTGLGQVRAMRRSQTTSVSTRIAKTTLCAL